jgi:hypothetical protein
MNPILIGDPDAGWVAPVLAAVVADEPVVVADELTLPVLLDFELLEHAAPSRLTAARNESVVPAARRPVVDNLYGLISVFPPR